MRLRAPPFIDPPGYVRHRPEATLLYQLIERHYPELVAAREAAGRPRSRADFDWAMEKLRAYRLNNRCEILFSPSWGQVDAASLADWVLKKRAPVRFQMQLHKLL